MNENAEKDKANSETELDIEDIALKLEELGGLAYSLAMLHENCNRLGQNAMRLSDTEYIRIFNFISAVAHEEKDKLNLIAAHEYNEKKITDGSRTKIENEGASAQAYNIVNDLSYSTGLIKDLTELAATCVNEKEDVFSRQDIVDGLFKIIHSFELYVDNDLLRVQKYLQGYVYIKECVKAEIR